MLWSVTTYVFNYLREIENSKDNAVNNLIEKINFIFFKMSELESIFGLFRSQEPKFYIILIFRERKLQISDA